MKNKKGSAIIGVAIVAIIAIILMLGALTYFEIKNTKQSAVGGSSSTIYQSTGSGGTGCSQNPAISPLFTDAATGGSITPVIANSLSNGKLTGMITVSSGIMTPAIQAQTVITPFVNASGYISEWEPDYIVSCNPQSITGDMKAFKNESLVIYDNTNLTNIGSAQNSTSFTTQRTLTLKISGNAQKSTGKMYLVYEVSNTTAVNTVTLNSVNGAPAPSLVTAIPNCYTNTLTGTPYRVAYELPSVDSGTEVDYNLVISSLNSASIAGKNFLVIYNEQDGIDSLNSGKLTSEICDSNNRFFGVGGTFGASGAPSSNGISGQGISNTWYFN